MPLRVSSVTLGACLEESSEKGTGSWTWRFWEATPPEGSSIISPSLPPAHPVNCHVGSLYFHRVSCLHPLLSIPTSPLCLYLTWALAADSSLASLVSYRCPNPMLEFSKCNSWFSHPPYLTLVLVYLVWNSLPAFGKILPLDYVPFPSDFSISSLPRDLILPLPPNLGSNCSRMSHYVRLLSSYSVIMNLRLGLHGLLAPS